jgi:DNA-binding MarR family transcriptional regulator
MHSIRVLDPNPTTGFLLWRLSMRWRVLVDRALADLGLTHAQYVVLGPLYAMNRRDQQPSQRELADYAGMEAIYVSKLVRSLEQAGLLERTTHPDDTRAVQLRLTAEGMTVAEQTIEVAGDILERLLLPLGGSSGRQTIQFTEALKTLLSAPEPRIEASR